MYRTHFCDYKGQETVKNFTRKIGSSKPIKRLVVTFTVTSEPQVKERTLDFVSYHNLNGAVTGCFVKF